MSVKHLARTATVDEIAACVREHGHVVIDELVSAEVMDRIEAELQPYFDATPFAHLSESVGPSILASVWAGCAKWKTSTCRVQ